MIRRRKDEIAEQLPERIDNNYFVSMTAEQKKRYDEHEYPVSILMSIAKKRPLTPKEHEKLQLHLSCMRILCDSVYILDQSVSESPKVDEVINILNDIWDSSPDRKIIIFSEWVKMLELIKEKLEDNKVKFSWHVGSVPQSKRRDEINNFKNDPECKVFLSSDSGGIGLNLQAASVVINMDLPWNPAKLEQRIARAWRKHQKNSVNVINLIAEGTIEHRMLATLGFKQGLAEGVLDARGDIDAIEKPNAKNQFLERLASIMKTSFAEAKENDEITETEKLEINIPKEELFKQELEVDQPSNLKICNGVFDKDSGELKTVFAVSSNDKAINKLEEVAEKTGLKKEEDLVVINNETFELLQKLSKMGIISFNDNSMKEIYMPSEAAKEKEELWKQKQTMAEGIYKKAERSYKMSQVLKAGGFEDEAVKPLLESIGMAGKSLIVLANSELLESEPQELSKDSLNQIKSELKLNEDLIMFLSLCCINTEELENSAVDLYAYTEKLFTETAAIIAGQGL